MDEPTSSIERAPDFVERAPDFELPNVAVGPDPFTLSAVAADPDVDAIVLLFQRDYHCRNCRRQVRAIADRYHEFRELNASVVSVLPEPTERAQSWQDSYELPFPLLADPDAAAGDAYDQPVRFGALGSLHDLVGRMSVAMILDVREGEPMIGYTYEGRMPADRPAIDEFLEEIHELLET